MFQSPMTLLGAKRVLGLESILLKGLDEESMARILGKGYSKHHMRLRKSMKEHCFSCQVVDPSTSLSEMKTVPVSLAAAEQRRGRAGRGETQKGLRRGAIQHIV